MVSEKYINKKNIDQIFARFNCLIFYVFKYFYNNIIHNSGVTGQEVKEPLQCQRI